MTPASGRPAPRAPASGDPVRERIREAAIDLVIERGYEDVAIEDLLERAGVERAEFERRFESLEDCVLRAYWDYTDDFTARLRAAFEREAAWRDGLRAAAYTAARYIRDNPRIVRFGTIQLFGAGPMAQAQRESHLHQMVDLIDAGRQELDDPESVGRGVAEAAFGSIYEAVIRGIGAGEGVRSPLDFVPELMYVAVRPYLGHEVAREELTIPPPPEELGPEKPGGEGRPP
jgi:AcrR family transcriptional regulator